MTRIRRMIAAVALVGLLLGAGAACGDEYEDDDCYEREDDD